MHFVAKKLYWDIFNIRIRLRLYNIIFARLMYLYIGMYCFVHAFIGVHEDFTENTI